MIINMNGAKAPETPSPVLQEKTVTPETLPTVIGADEGYDGLSQVTVNPDSQLKAENIRSGKTIFGVTGAFVGEPVYTNEIDMDLFCPFNVMLQKSFATYFYELNGASDVKYDADIVETACPEGWIGIQRDTNVVTTNYNGFYMMCQNDKYGTTTYAPSSYSWFDVTATIPAGNHTLLAGSNSGYTHLKGDFVVYPALYPQSGLVNAYYVSSESDWNEHIIHVDTDVTKNASGNPIFTVTLSEDLTYHFKTYSYGSFNFTSVALTLLPYKAVYT